MFEVGRLLARITLEGAQTFGRDLRQVGAEFRALDAEGQRAANDLGVALAGVGAALLATSTLVAKAAIDWETAWAGVTKTVDGTPQQLAEVEAGLRGLTEILPATHAEIAAVAEAAGQLGVETDSVVAFTRTMIDLGETTNLTAQQAATELARFMNVMGTSQDDVSNLGSAIVGLGNNYATTEAEIVSMAQRLSGAGRQIGLTEGEVLGLATSLSSVGIEAEAGGSAISKVMIDIAASVDAGGERLDEFASVAGMSAEAFSAQWRTAPGEALAAFVTGLANAEQQGNTTLGVLESLGIVEVRMRDALLRSAAASDQFTDAMRQGNAEFEANNALTDEAAKRYATVESQLGMTWNAVVDLAIELGDHLLPAIADAAESVRAFAQFLGDLPDPVQNAVVVLGVGAGALALVGAAALLAVPKIVAFRASLQTLSSQMPTLAGRLSSFASFLAGPWGIALGAASVAVPLLTQALTDALDVSDRFANSLEGAATAQNALAVALSAGIDFPETEAARYVDSLDAALRDARRAWVEGGPRADEFTPVIEAVRVYGENLAKIAATDLPAAAQGFRLLADETDGSRAQLWALLSNMPAYRDALTTQATALGLNLETMTDGERQAALLDIATGNLADTSTDTAEAVDDLTVTVDGVTVSLKAMYDELNAVNAANLDAREAARQYQAALDDFDAAVARNGSTLDITTEAGRENQAALDAIAEAALRAAQATLDAGGSEAEYRAALVEGRAAILERLEALGLTTAEAQELADTILNMPTDREIQIRVEQEAARAMLQAFVDEWSGREIPIPVSPYIPANRLRGVQADIARLTGQALAFREADGGVVDYYATGGIREHHVAQIASAGSMRVWAEPETGGEAYIPLDPAKRGRSVEILRDVARRFGLELGDGSGTATAVAERSAGPVRLVGTLDLGDGLTGVVRGMIVENEGDTLAGIWGEQP